MSFVQRVFFFFLNFYFSNLVSHIHGNLIVGINTKSALRDEGYVWVPETRDFTENSGKYLKNPKFLVFLRSTVF